MKKKIIILSGVLILILLILGYFFINGKKKKVTKIFPTPTPVEDMLPTISPEDLKVTLVSRDDKKAVFLKIDKFPKGTKMIEYEMSYDTDGVERGVMGTITIETDRDVINREVLLGTCSKNVCVYDKNVFSIKLVLRIDTKTGMKSWSKEFPLTENQ